jgi:hypothetical protein
MKHTLVAEASSAFCIISFDIYGEEVNIIHPDISPDTAAKLGVPSLTETLLEEAERLEEWGQNEPLTRRIKDLLKAYTFTSQCITDVLVMWIKNDHLISRYKTWYFC